MASPAVPWCITKERSWKLKGCCKWVRCLARLTSPYDLVGVFFVWPWISHRVQDLSSWVSMIHHYTHCRASASLQILVGLGSDSHRFRCDPRWRHCDLDSPMIFSCSMRLGMMQSLSTSKGPTGSSRKSRKIMNMCSSSIVVWWRLREILEGFNTTRELGIRFLIDLALGKRGSFF